MRAREFLMKDAYSFHTDEASLAQATPHVRRLHAYFTRIGLKFRAVQADAAPSRDTSQEFHVLADSGEDAIVFSDADDYAPIWKRPRPAAAARAAAAEALTK